MYRCDVPTGGVADADAWYLFDPMDGSLDFVHTGGWEAAYRHRYAGGPSIGHHRGDAEYTAMIFGRSKLLATRINMSIANMPAEHAIGLPPSAPRLHPHPSFCVPSSASAPSIAKRRNEIMGRASRVLSDMELRGGDGLDASYHVGEDAGNMGGVVQVLRDERMSVTGTKITGKRIRGGGYDLDEETPSILVWQ